jgi:hypothetical protein
VAIADHVVRLRDWVPSSAFPTFTISTVGVPYSEENPNNPLSPFEFGEMTRFYGQTSPVPGIDTGSPDNPHIEDFDDDGDVLTFEVVQPPAHGELVEFHGDTGRFVYEHPGALVFPQRDLRTGDVLKDIADEDGDGDLTEDLPWVNYGYDWFVYQVSDGHSTSEAKVLIEFSATSGGPPQVVQTHVDGVRAEDEAYEVQAGHWVNVPKTTGLLQNDNVSDYHHVSRDIVDAAVGPYIVRGPSHGRLEMGGNGAFAYRADSDFIGLESVFYHLQGDPQPLQRELSHPAVVSFVVRNTSPDPEPDRYWTAADEPLAIDVESGLLANDSDFNDQSLFVLDIIQPLHGEVRRSGLDGWFHYQPAPGFHGVDTFEYVVSDGFDIARSTVTITVHDPASQGDVANVESPDGRNVVLISSPGTTLANVRVTEEPPAAHPEWLDFPLGYFQFEIHGVPVGGAATVRMILPPDAPVLNTYWKYGPTFSEPHDHWYPFFLNFSSTVGAEFEPGEIVLHFIDGQAGDRTNADGVIIDPGGPAIELVRGTPGDDDIQVIRIGDERGNFDDAPIYRFHPGQQRALRPRDLLFGRLGGVLVLGDEGDTRGDSGDMPGDERIFRKRTSPGPLPPSPLATPQMKRTLYLMR